MSERMQVGNLTVASPIRSFGPTALQKERYANSGGLGSSMDRFRDLSRGLRLVQRVCLRALPAAETSRLICLVSVPIRGRVQGEYILCASHEAEHVLTPLIQESDAHILGPHGSRRQQCLRRAHDIGATAPRGLVGANR